MSGSRITHKDAEGSLRAYCAIIGAPFGHYVTLHDPAAALEIVQDGGTFEVRVLSTHDDGRRFCTIPGGYALAGMYQGWQVQRLTDEVRSDGSPGTGVSVPFGHGVNTAREIVAQLQAARYAVADYKDSQR